MESGTELPTEFAGPSMGLELPPYNEMLSLVGGGCRRKAVLESSERCMFFVAVPCQVGRIVLGWQVVGKTRVTTVGWLFGRFMTQRQHRAWCAKI